MAGNKNELSLSEMRLLTSSVVHMDVKQIALCVVTIPKLKAAIQELMQSTPPSLNSISQTKTRSRAVLVNGEPSSGRWSDLDNGDMDMDIANNPPEPNPTVHQKPSVDHNTERSDVTKSSPPVRIPLDAVLAESARGSTEFSMVGDRIAIGKPGKSKAKTEKRVRYITCRVCHLLFYKRDQYREHMRIHANDPSISVYSCDHCSFVTKRRGVFNTHVLRHTGDLPFKCKLCDYAGRQVSLLRQHMQNKHPDHEDDMNGNPSPISQIIKIEGSKCDVEIKDSDHMQDSNTLLMPEDI